MTTRDQADQRAHRKYLQEKYVRIRPIVVEESPNARTVWLKVGPQEFCVTSQYCDTFNEARFMAKMLAQAIQQILYNEGIESEG